MGVFEDVFEILAFEKVQIQSEHGDESDDDAGEAGAEGVVSGVEDGRDDDGGDQGAAGAAGELGGKPQEVAGDTGPHGVEEGEGSDSENVEHVIEPGAFLGDDAIHERDLEIVGALVGDAFVDAKAQAGDEAIEHHGPGAEAGGPEEVEGKQLGDLLDERDADEVSCPTGGDAGGVDPGQDPLKGDHPSGEGHEADGKDGGTAERQQASSNVNAGGSEDDVEEERPEQGTVEGHAPEGGGEVLRLVQVQNHQQRHQADEGQSHDASVLAPGESAEVAQRQHEVGGETQEILGGARRGRRRGRRGPVVCRATRWQSRLSEDFVHAGGFFFGAGENERVGFDQTSIQEQLKFLPGIGTDRMSPGIDQEVGHQLGPITEAAGIWPAEKAPDIPRARGVRLSILIQPPSRTAVLEPGGGHGRWEQNRLVRNRRFGNVAPVKWLWLLVAACGFAPEVVAQPAPARPPNLVVIVADDLGWTDAGFAGSRFYETPNLDALAAQGLRLTSFYTGPMGAPTMAALLTGLSSPRNGVYSGDVAAVVEPAVVNDRGWVGTNLAAVLKGAGYASGYLGVWRLGAEGEAHPAKRGFDETVLVTPKHQGFEVQPSAEVPAGMHLTDYLTDRCLEFLDRNKDKPFFLVVSHFSVHAPAEPKADWVGRFEKKPPAGGHRDAGYAAMIAGLDESVGKVVARLESLHLTDRTVLVFLSDNGGVGGYLEVDNGGRRSGVTDNSPLRGGKGMVFDGGMRVPFVVRWPGVVPGGSRSIVPTAVADLFPTLCDIAGVRPEAGYPLEGLNLLPLWRDPTHSLGRDALYWHFPDGIVTAENPPIRTPPVSLVRAGNFKLIEWLEDGRVELYNLMEDLGEKNNLVRSLPDKAAELKAKAAAWRKAANARVPERKPAAPAAATAPKASP